MKYVHNSLRFKTCPLCNSHRLSRLGDIFYFSPIYYSTIQIELSNQPELWKCKECKSKFVQNIITQADSKNLYKMGNSDEKWCNREFKESKTKVVVNQLSELLKPNMRVLDVGCSTGEFLDFAKSRGCITHGVEYSESCARILREKGHVVFPNTESLNGEFDVITGFDLLEHLYDLPAFLSENISRLSEQGIMVFVTGDANSLPAKLAGSNWWYSRFPEHIVFPSKKYFSTCLSLKISDWIPTYAGSGYQVPLTRVLKSNLKAVVTRNFSGFHTPIPDHALIALKKQT
jgi:SAM-dependent methyltransferase